MLLHQDVTPQMYRSDDATKKPWTPHILLYLKYEAIHGTRLRMICLTTIPNFHMWFLVQSLGRIVLFYFKRNRVKGRLNYVYNHIEKVEKEKFFSPF